MQNHKRLLVLTSIVAQAVVAAATSAAPVLPDFSAATFLPGAPIDNPYFPMVPGVQRVYEGEVDGVIESFELTNIGPGPVILGVQTSTQRDRAFEEGLLVEETFDHYAQDTVGNVWYMGEDVTNYEYDEFDVLIGTNSSSSWRAGVNSGLPGFIMPAAQSPAFSYYQEFSPFDAAIDEAQTLAADRELSIDFGDFSDVLAVLETLATEPDARGIKYYAPGFGLIAEDEGVALDFMDYEARIELISATTVPVPAALPLFGVAMASLLGAGLRRDRCQGPDA